MRNVGTPKNASFDKVTAVPVDIRYRIKRIRDSLTDAIMYLNSIDEAALANHEQLLDALRLAQASADDAEELRPSTGPEAKAGRTPETLETLLAARQALFEEEAG